MSLTNTLTDIFTGIAGEMWGIFLDAAPYIFLGFGVAGLLHIFIPDEKIMDYLGASAGKFRVSDQRLDCFWTCTGLCLS
jgi:uncharacterized membrane protein YraQ (UPF0718 family)